MTTLTATDGPLTTKKEGLHQTGMHSKRLCFLNVGYFIYFINISCQSNIQCRIVAGWFRWCGTVWNVSYVISVVRNWHRGLLFTVWLLRTPPKKTCKRTLTCSHYTTHCCHSVRRTFVCLPYVAVHCFVIIVVVVILIRVLVGCPRRRWDRNTRKMRNEIVWKMKIYYFCDRKHLYLLCIASWWWWRWWWWWWRRRRWQHRTFSAIWHFTMQDDTSSAQ